MRFKSLRTKITIWTIGAMLIVPILVGVVILLKQYEIVSQFSRTVGESDAILKSTLLRDIDHAMMVNQLDGVDKVLQEVSRFRGVRGVYLLDSRGRDVIAHGGADGRTSDHAPKLTDDQYDLLLGQGREVQVFRHELGESIRLLALPILNKDECRVCHMLTKVNGALLIKQRSMNLKSETSFMVGIMVISLLVAGIASALTMLTMLSRTVIGPLRDLSQAARRVGQCDLDVRATVDGEGEVAELTRSFNSMVDDLKRSRGEVENRSLKCEEAYKHLRDTQKKLVQSEKLAAIGTLVAGMAHEINNPVGVIATRTDCMLMEAREKGLSEQCTEDLAVINRHAARIAAITQSLLTFARQGPVETAPVDVNAVVEDTLFLVDKQFTREGITIERRLPEPPPRIMGDENRLQQVLLNLFNNSREAMPGGGSITVSTAVSGNVVEITATDTGEGIPEEVLDNIFDPFFTTRAPGKGTGLGLAVSYGIIQNMGGVIEAESEKGVGSTFTITLPILKAV